MQPPSLPPPTPKKSLPKKKKTGYTTFQQHTLADVKQTLGQTFKFEESNKYVALFWGQLTNHQKEQWKAYAKTQQAIEEQQDRA